MRSRRQVKTRPITRTRPLAPTAKQLEVFSYIVKYISIWEYPPSCGDLRDHFGWKSLNAGDEYLNALHVKGLIYRSPGVSRGIRIIRKDLAKELTGITLRFE